MEEAINEDFGDLASPIKITDEDLMLGHHNILAQHQEPHLDSQHHVQHAADVDLALKRTHDQADLDDEDNTAKRLKMLEEGDASAAAAVKKVNHEQWDSMFERLGAYKELHGDCLVPKRYAADPKLGTWVETQRVQYKRLERAVDEASGIEAVQPNKRLNQPRLEKLQSIGFAWSAKNVRKPKPPPQAGMGKLRKGGAEDSASRIAARNRVADIQWQELFQRLALYKQTHGDCLVPRKYEADPKLASWVETQRVLWNRDFREGGGAMTPSEIAKATALDLPEPANVPLSATAIGKSPEEWEQEIGKAESGGATAEDAAYLAATMTGDGLLHGDGLHVTDDVAHAGVPMDTVDGPLGDEVAKLPAPQIRRLTQDRKERLDALGFVWSLRNKRIDDHWDEMYRQLVEYKETYGDCLVPSRYETNLKLGKWVETQRYEKTKLQRVFSGGEPKEQEIDPASGKPRATNPRLTEERLRRLEVIGFEWKVKHKMKRYYDKQWDQMLERLLKFKDDNGHCMVPKRYPPDMKLGTWVHTQRIQYRKMIAGAKKDSDTATISELGSSEYDVSFRLTEERRKRLQEAGFIWSARECEKGVETGRITRNSYDDQWDQMFQKLKEYKETRGDCLVPKRFKDDPKLGTWVDTQRVQFKKMKKKLEEQGVAYEGPGSASSTVPDDDTGQPPNPAKPVVGRLTDDRIRRLEDLGFVWSLRDDWQKHYNELKVYKAEHTHCNVPARYAKNRRLGIWVSAQRQQYKFLKTPVEGKFQRPSPLTQERIDLLNELGFTWTIRSRDSLGESWNERLQSLREYCTIHGNCLVPSRYPSNPELGVWVGTQRTQFRLYLKAKETGQPLSGMSAMNEDRIRQLEDLGFIWALRGQEGSKKEADPLGAGSIEEEAMQVAGALPSEAHEDDPMAREADQDGDLLRHAIEHAAI